MTYPPADHFLRDLGYESTLDEAGPVLRAAVQPNALSHGGIRLGVLAVFADMVAAQAALPAIAPDWCATDSLDIHRLDDAAHGWVELRPTILRLGSKSVIVAVEGTDDNGRSIATGTVGFRRIPGTASVVSGGNAEANQARFSMPSQTSPPDDLVAACGIIPTGPTKATMEITDYVRNSFGSINGGILALGFDTVAERAAQRGPAVDLTMRFLRQSKAGPAEFRAVHRGPRLLYDLSVCDRSTGSDLAVGVVTVL